MTDVEDQMKQEIRKLEINLEEVSGRLNIAREHIAWLVDRIQTLEKIANRACQLARIEEL